MLNGKDQVIHGMPIDCGISRGFLPCLNLGRHSRMVPFGGGNDSDSEQSTVSKDNKAIVEDDGQNSTDGAASARDDGFAAVGDKNTSSVLTQSGFSFAGAHKTTIEPGSALLLASGVVLSVYIYSKK